MTIESAEATLDAEDGLDELSERVWATWRERYEERLSWIGEQWERAVEETPTASGTVAVAYDGDAAGQKALDEILVKSLNLSDTETSYIRNLSINRLPIPQAVRSLTNWDLAEELAFWTHAKKSKSPDWYQEMCEDFIAACLSEITSRSKKVNDLGGFDYIDVYNANNTITDVLQQYGVSAVPGRTTRCPMHDDSTPSLSVSKDNGRAFCFNQACILWGNGHGESAFGLMKILGR